MDIVNYFYVKKTKLIYEFVFKESALSSLGGSMGPNISKSFANRLCSRTALMVQVFGKYEITEFYISSEGRKTEAEYNTIICGLKQHLEKIPFQEMETYLNSLSTINKYQL